MIRIGRGGSTISSKRYCYEMSKDIAEVLCKAYALYDWLRTEERTSSSYDIELEEKDWNEYIVLNANATLRDIYDSNSGIAYMNAEFCEECLLAYTIVSDIIDKGADEITGSMIELFNMGLQSMVIFSDVAMDNFDSEVYLLKRKIAEGKVGEWDIYPIDE